MDVPPRRTLLSMDLSRKGTLVSLVVSLVPAVVEIIREAALAVIVTMAMGVTVAIAVELALAMTVPVAMPVPVAIGLAMPVAAIGTSFTHAAEICFPPRAKKLPQPDARHHWMSVQTRHWYQWGICLQRRHRYQ